MTSTTGASGAAHDASLLAAIVEATSDTVLSIDLDGVITSFNAAGAELFRVDAADMVGRRIQEIATGEQLVEQTDMMRRVFAGEHVHVASTTRTRSDGTRLDLSIASSPIRDASGMIVGACAVMRDITELARTRRELEHQRELLAASEEQFRRTFEDSLAPMWIGSLSGTFMILNDAACAFLGRPREQLVGSHLRVYTHPDEEAVVSADVQALLRGERSSYTRERRFVRPDGSIVWAIVGVTLMRNAEGVPLNVLVQAQDVTDRRQYEQQLQHMADHDPLSGLLNRRSFDRELRRQFAERRRPGPRGALLMIDLDNFKRYNDTFGHTAGDALLETIARELRERLRTDDVIGRIGGDEFAVLLPGASNEEAEKVAQVLVECVRAASGRQPHGHAPVPGVTASIGIYCFEEQDEASIAEATIRADQAMYLAKRRGRDGFVAYNAGAS
ncbi:MAG TPA: PAS domain S-box protein [Solirubrobacteraceae bacterium]|nr:PAS domain S-box protein [Solirubrobacteraceae bacterium]